MRFKLVHSLGTVDAHKCAIDFGCSFPKADGLTAGSEIELTDDAAAFLKRKYPGLLEPSGNVKAVPPTPLKAPSKE